MTQLAEVAGAAARRRRAAARRPAAAPATTAAATVTTTNPPPAAQPRPSAPRAPGAPGRSCGSRRASTIRNTAPNSDGDHAGRHLDAPACAPSTHRTSTSAPSTTTIPDSADTGSSARCRSRPGTRGPSSRTIAGAAQADEARSARPRSPRRRPAARRAAPPTSRVRRGFTPEHGGGVVAEAVDVQPARQQRPARPRPASTSGAIQVTDDRPYWPSEPLPQANRPVVLGAEQQQQRRPSPRPGPARSPSRPAPGGSGPDPAAGGQRQHQRRPRPGRRGTPGHLRTAPAATSAARRPAPAAGTRRSRPPSSVRCGERVARHRLQRRARDSPSATPTSTPASSRGIRDGDDDRDLPARCPGPPSSSRTRSPTPTSAVPWVRCTAASSDGRDEPTTTTDATRRRRTGVAAGGAAVRDDTADYAPSVVTSASTYCVHRGRAAEHPDAVRHALRPGPPGPPAASVHTALSPSSSTYGSPPSAALAM